MAAPFRVVIPARFASTRLPAKPLADIGGQAMVVRVAERARASGAEAVVVATDHETVKSVVEAAGFVALMTSPDHASGTERLVEVVDTLGWDDAVRVVNVQGDEPLIDPALVNEVAALLDGADMATLGHAIVDPAEFANPNVVKLVRDAQGHALYFSRAPIPWPRDAMMRGAAVAPGALRHIGLYAYRAGFLRGYARLAPSPLESVEMLEQLRVLWHGHRIAVGLAANAPAPGVDTAEDLERVRALFAR